MKQTIVLVDYENVGGPGLEGLPKNARILLLIGKKQALPAPNVIKKSFEQGKRLDLIKIAESGNNNLDLHLAFYLGKMLAEEPNAEYIIVTKDKTDFGPLVAHLESLGVTCKRQDAPAKAPTPPQKAKETPKPAAAPKTPPAPAVKATAPKPVAAKASPPKNAAVTVARNFLEAEKHPPKTREKLLPHLQRRLKLTPLQTGGLIEELEKDGFIQVSPSGKVNYLTKNNSPSK